ncbi:conserved hypothetical protein [Altererythrobacter sp. B11]|uniref:hypothetical protein n=1 Tax=Altererythrobacter sp. B11 TaxID=2060312 RepID=UPI000DC7330F|nr:hypothetical protein [Altererythrobacter sp. B11]BBC73056.1 conserved hypothetical protein [Altererythrobacter sp. B11]
MTAHRATALLVGATAALTLASAPASAQVSDDIVINILRECAKIDDPGARLACYDNNIRSAGAAPRRTVPGAAPAPAGSATAPVGSGTSGFGSEDVRASSPERFARPEGEAERISARVTSVREREPGVYLVGMEDGAQWLFSESVDRFYQPPRKGDTVEIRRAALGSYLMQIGKQAAVRVERVK